MLVGVADGQSGVGLTVQSVEPVGIECTRHTTKPLAGPVPDACFVKTNVT